MFDQVIFDKIKKFEVDLLRRRSHELIDENMRPFIQQLNTLNCLATTNCCEAHPGNEDKDTFYITFAVPNMDVYLWLVRLFELYQNNLKAMHQGPDGFNELMMTRIVIGPKKHFSLNLLTESYYMVTIGTSDVFFDERKQRCLSAMGNAINDWMDEVMDEMMEASDKGHY